MKKYCKTIEVLNKENEISYYILGAFITDGNVHQDKSRTNSFRSCIASYEKDWLELINSFLMHEGKLRKDKPDTKNMYSMWFYNKPIYDWFVQHNCIPKKSLCVEMPKIPDEYFKDFLRGCIDGDGSICRSKYKASKNNKIYEQTFVYLVGASFTFLKAISEKLNLLNFNHSFITTKPQNGKIKNQIIYGKNNIYRIQFSGHKKCVNFLKWLYADAKIAMPRKHKIALSILNDYDK